MARWAVVLGASSGFGAATAIALANEGYNLLAIHLDLRSTLPRAEQVKAQVQATGVQSIWCNGNAAKPAKMQAMLDELHAQAPDAQVHVVFHSLAFGTLRPVLGPEALQPKQIHMTSDVMGHSLVAWVHALDERGLLAEGGRILAMTSLGARRPIPGYGAVSAAKAALEAWVRQLALVLAPRHITVNAIEAGLTRTPALQAIPNWEALAERAEAHHPHGRLTEPDDVAQMVVALLHPGTRWLTGNTLQVDGGESLGV